MLEAIAAASEVGEGAALAELTAAMELLPLQDLSAAEGALEAIAQEQALRWEAAEGLGSRELVEQPIIERVELDAEVCRELRGLLPDAPGAHEIGQMGLEGAKHHLREAGDTAIEVFDGGGPGGALPDIVSLTEEGVLRVTEAKGTLAGTPLEGAGLGRPDIATGTTVYELSPEWLAKSGPKLLEAIGDRIEEATDPVRLADLERLREAVAQMVESNYRDIDAYRRTVVQTGTDLPAIQPEKLDGFIRAARPHEIVQQVLT